MKWKTKALPLAILMAALAHPFGANAQVAADIRFDVMTLGINGLNVFQLEMHPDGRTSGWYGLSSVPYEMTLAGPNLAAVSFELPFVIGSTGGQYPYPIPWSWTANDGVAWFEDGTWHLVGSGAKIDFAFFILPEFIDFYIFVGEESPVPVEGVHDHEPSTD